MRAPFIVALLLSALGPGGSGAQTPAEPVLSGRVRIGEEALASGTVILHRMSEQGGGELDSVALRGDGSFSIPLPAVPNPVAGEMYFASVTYEGVLYFGHAITTAVQLDSLYEIQAYDTLLAPVDGASVALEARNIFLEPNGDVWQATDVFQLRNDGDRTVVARPGGRVWSYPLPEEAREVMTGEGEVSPDAAAFEDGSLVVRAALPPGERLFVVRYLLDSPAVEIPTPGETELFDLLVREPAPPLEVGGMTQIETVELDPGQTFRHYAAQAFAMPFLAIEVGEPVAPPPVYWIAVMLAVVLATGGLLAFRGRTESSAVETLPDDRQTILLSLARLDEEFERQATPSTSAKQQYRRRRDDLMRRLKTRT